MFQIAGGAIGLGLTTTIFTTSSENELADKASGAGTELTAHQTGVLHGILAGTDTGNAAFQQLGTSAAAKVEQFVRESFASGIQTGFRFVALAALAGLAISVLFVGGGPKREPAGEPAAEAAG